MNDITASSSVILDSLLIDDSLITCEVCFEVFNHENRPPKLLPCGHNFCESCIFSLCLHQEYYLLDSIKCPTCRREFTTNTARQAPTNYDLCKILENLFRRKEQNVTVIEVPELVHNLPPPMAEVSSSATKIVTSQQQQQQQPAVATKMPRHHVSKKMKALAKRTEESKHFRCADCQRKISQKNLFRVSRYCVDCTSTSRMTIVCLECCVNHHNGHDLLTEDSLHHNQLKTLSDLRKLRHRILDSSDEFDRRADEIRTSGMDVCGGLSAEKHNLLTYTLASIDDVMRRIEMAPILFPPVLRTIRDEQSHNFSRLEKLSAQLEKSLVSRKNTKPTSLTFIENMNDTTYQGLQRSVQNQSLNKSTLSIRQSRVSLRTDDSLFHESISSLTRLMHQHPMCLQLEFHHSTVSSKDTVTQRKQKIMSCAHATTSMLDMDLTQVSMVPIFADVLLNCFYQLNRLSKNKFVGDKKYRRCDIWKQVQCSYTELFGITAKHFPSHHPERVDILDDLAYLCHLYSDVADQGTVTICLIEAARARASDSSGLTEIEQQRSEERLELIDEHLTECRRLQKLLELRKTSKTKKNGGLKRLFGGCFIAQEKANDSLVY
ncbi:RING-type domain-containing protein [Caenorhabditis elegans]|uniref:RING-type domain-containing protein n=1 Tax=Caenorhabditis elegans TaxID=6239 RepID=O76354_CAEEL|nr:RING-type domain-containing protein [Caenorhabditis elegans]CCD65532.1 RING-type domain-containing protein [Caenorhabditis elegans]|eukprot:NP_500203.1 Uncharacterized protein CELE_C45G7.4 [Caenorhabditis elegans]